MQWKRWGSGFFRDYETNWHFDDKIGEQYLLEAIGAPVVPGYVFYTLREALEWIDKGGFPKVFKLLGRGRCCQRSFGEKPFGGPAVGSGCFRAGLFAVR